MSDPTRDPFPVVHRRRTTAAVVATALAVAAIAAVPALAGVGSGGPDRVDGPEPTIATPFPVLRLRCSEVPAGADQEGPSEVRPGPIAVRLCPEDGTGIQPPADVLSSRLDDLVDLVNTAPAAGRDCPAGDGEPRYALLFGYADGSSHSVSGELSGCRILTAGGVARVGAERPYDRALELIADQRSSSKPIDVTPPELGCPGDAIDVSPLGSVLEVEYAVLCVGDDARVAVGDDELDTLLGHLRTGVAAAEPAGGDCRDLPELALVGGTAWGDRVVAPGSCGAFDVGDGPIRPSEEVRRVLDELVAEAGGR